MNFPEHIIKFNPEEYDKPSFTFLKNLEDFGPRGAYYKKEARMNDPEYETDHVGNMVEMSIMDPKGFNKTYVVSQVGLPDKDTKTYAFMKSFVETGSIQKAKVLSQHTWKADTLQKKVEGEWANLIGWLHDTQGKKVITNDQYDMCVMVREMVRQDPIFTSFLEGCEYQKPVFGEWNGVKFRGFTDGFNPTYWGGRPAVMEIKTGTYADIRFERQATTLKVKEQTTMYMDATNSEIGIILAVSTKRPYDYQWHYVVNGNDTYLKAQKTYRQWLSDFKEIKEKNLWHMGSTFHTRNSPMKGRELFLNWQIEPEAA